MKRWFLPTVLIIFGLISWSTLNSIVPDLAVRQMLLYLLGMGIFFIASRVTAKTLSHYAPMIYAVTLTLLLLVLFTPEVKGSSRWFDLGFFSLQPSQLLIVSMLAMVSWFTRRYSLRRAPLLALMCILLAVPAGLVMLEPDLGTTIIYLATSGMVLFLFSSWRHLVFLSIVMALVAVIGWSWVLHPYQKTRITSFLSPTGTSQTTGYNAQQSMIAVGSGQWFGTGIGQGSQSHLRFLPEKHTDFFFASFAEEFGFLGSLIILCLYCALCGYCVWLAIHTHHLEGKILCFGAASFIWLQTMINIGMNSGLFPITGVTLPFLSYGGSSLLSLTLMLGLVQGVARTHTPKGSIHIQ